uniref:Enoyl-CoA hydratase domain-containing protein 3, mitochondrial n=1 Tax=Microcebus murinus TaxID=30608 RepID=A0A8C6EL74_MICMU
GRPGLGLPGRRPRGPARSTREPWGLLGRPCTPKPSGSRVAARRGAGPFGRRNIVLSNPKKRNALSLAMLKSLQNDILHEAESNDLKVIVISGRDGQKRFLAILWLTGVMMLIRNHPVPVIAMVNGLATAAGCQLVASCDIAVASDKASFATPGVNVGLFCSTLRCPGESSVALEMLLTGEPISAQDALLHGLLSKVVPEPRLQEETMRIAAKIASLSRPVVSLGKATFYKQLPQDLKTAYCLSSQAMVDNLALRDGQEGISAFLQKRPPVWSH